MSAIVWLSLVSFAFTAICQVEGSFGYELLVTRLENLEERLTKWIVTSSNATNARLIDRLTKLETTILSKQRSTENRINDITASISTLSDQSRQILKNHDDLVISSCDAATLTGIYRLQALKLDVFCEMHDRGGRWLVIQRQIGSDVISFERNWYNYKTGFGKIGADTSFWLGLEALHRISNAGDYELLVRIRNEKNEYRAAFYSRFKVSGEDDWYRLTVGGYTGTAGDKLPNNAKFSTFDSDNDGNADRNCAADFHTGWWFTYWFCRNSNLNGPYNKASNGYGIEWGDWAKAAVYSEMMIRRKH